MTTKPRHTFEELHLTW